MKIYIVERDTPYRWEYPEVYMEWEAALSDVQVEYENKMQELGTSQKKSDAGYGNYGCCWNVCNAEHALTATIDGDDGADRWIWRVSEHLV